MSGRNGRRDGCCLEWECRHLFDEPQAATRRPTVGVVPVPDDYPRASVALNIHATDISCRVLLTGQDALSLISDLAEGLQLLADSLKSRI